MNLKGFLSDFISIVYPQVCLLCPETLVKGEQLLCTNCLVNLPKTTFKFGKPNPVDQIFWGRVRIEGATALLWFEKGGVVQTLLHLLKYKGKKELGIYLGRMLGVEIAKYSTGFDIICPVPLHKNKLKIRGFNQSECIAKGVSEIIKKPVITNAIYRTHFTETQTKKTKIDRWENVKDVFQLRKPEAFSNTKVLLIDDVATTGATLEACARAFNGTQSDISVATLAYAL